MGDKMNQEVIDIIIPMYNAEKTIEKEFIIPEYLKDAIYSVTEKKL